MAKAESLIATRIVTLERARTRARASRMRWVVLAGVVVFAIALLAPLVLILLNAFKSASDYSAHGPLTWPEAWRFENVTTYISQVNFGQKLLNSVVVSTSVALLTCAVSLLAAYAIGIGRVRGRRLLMAMMLIATMLPQEALLYPLFGGIQASGLSGTVLPLVVVLSVLNAGFGVYFLSTVLNEFPRALIEAAELDGAGRMRILWNVVIPIARPSVMVLLVLTFIGSWNEFLIPLVLLTSPDTQTVPIALATLQSSRFLDATQMAAASLISVAPTIVFFLVFQRSIMRGVSLGALK